MCPYRKERNRIHDVEKKEKIKVYIRYQNGKTVCICCRNKKGCNKDCDPDVVERDRFNGWEDTFQRNRYGKYPYPDKSNNRRG